MKDSHEAVVAIGSNQGDSITIMQQTLGEIDRHPDMAVKACSPVYQTAPWGHLEQPDFFNAAFTIETSYSARNLLKYFKQLEQAQGREKTMRWGPRILDLDLIFFDDVEQESPELTLPHPGVYTRSFVLVPLMALNPQASWPKIGHIQSYIKNNQIPSDLKPLTEQLWGQG